MYKVFLVDDEVLVIKSLIASVDWQAYGFEVAGYALSGSEAFDAIQAIDPHLVLTDIRMPGISGLELIKLLKDASCKALIVVLSGYAEFALAQKAINYGAVGYCLKPFDEFEIAGFLKKAVNIIKAEKGSKHVAILECLELDTAEAREKLTQILVEAGIHPSTGKQLMVAVSIGKSRLQHDGLQRGITIPIGRQKYAYLLQENAAVRSQLQAAAATGSDIRGIGVSKTFEGGDRLQQAIQQAIREGELEAYRFFTMGGSTAEQAPSASKLPSRYETIKALEEAIARKDIKGIVSSLDSASMLFAGGLMNIQDALTLFNQTVSFIDREQDLLWEEFIYSYDQLTDSFGAVQDVIAYLKAMLAGSFQQANVAGAQQIKNRSLKAILHYVEEHYREELTIPILSDKFNVNANYISQLFRKETGATFTQYVTGLRIEHACRLLSGTDLPINEVAEQAGYSDYFYFSRIFKRAKGTTPSSYRTLAHE
jgi:two-component system response regulator YesN